MSQPYRQHYGKPTDLLLSRPAAKTFWEMVEEERSALIGEQMDAMAASPSFLGSLRRPHRWTASFARKLHTALVELLEDDCERLGKLTR